MSLMFRLALLPLLLPPSLALAQVPARALRGIRFGTDTMDSRDAGRVRDGAAPLYSIRTVTRGTGADAGAVVEVIRFESLERTGRVTLVSIDSVVANEADLRLRRARNLNYTVRGTVNLDATTQVRGLTLERHYKSEFEDTTSVWKIAAPDQIPVGSERLLLEAVDLDATWHPRIPTWNGKADALSFTQVDSIWPGTVDGRRVWMVDMHPERYVKGTLTIDSATRTVMRTDWRATNGTPVGSSIARTPRRGAGAGPSVALQSTPVQRAAGTLPSTLAGVARLPRLDTPDTLDFEVSGVPHAPGKVFRSQIIRTHTLGRGDSAGQLIRISEMSQRREDGGLDLRSTERSTIDARSFAFRTLRRRTVTASDVLLIEASHTLVENRVRAITTRADGKVDTTWADIPVGGPPFASADELFRAAPLSKNFRGVFEVFSALEPFHQPLVIDSVRLLRTSSQRMTGPQWRVSAHVDSAGATLMHMETLVDTATREIAVLEWKRTDGIRSVYVNRRFTRRADTPALLPPAGKIGKAEQAAAGHYYLEGVREVGSEILLRPDGRFEYMLAYGALDESGAGSWRVENGAVVLQSDGTPHQPSVVLESSTGTATDSITVFVKDTLGRPLSGVEIDFVRENSGTKFEHTRQGRYTHRFERADTPVEIAVGYDIAGFMQTFDLTRPPAAEYHFVFDRGDLGTRRFDGERLMIEKDAIVMTRNNRQMRYVRH